MDHETWAFLGPVVGVTIGTLGTAIVNLLMANANIGRIKRADAIKEWEKLTDRQQAEIDQLKVQVKDLLKEVFGIHNQHSECRRENAELVGKVNMLQMRVDQLLLATTPPTIHVSPVPPSPPITPVAVILVPQEHQEPQKPQEPQESHERPT